MFKKYKRYFILAGLVVLLVLTGYLNFALNQPSDPADTGDKQTSTSTSSANFFKDFRADREAVRAKEIEFIDSLIASEDVDAETLKDAQQQKLELAQLMEKEVTIEGMIKAKGFEEAVVTLHKGSVNVVVSADQLTDAQVAQILDIVKRESGESAENIKIMTKS